MSEEESSRVYTINLSKVFLSPKYRRTKRAINMIKQFAKRHMKSEEITIDENLNKQVWKRGIKHPPRKVRVKMVKDEDGMVTVSLYQEEAKEEEVEEEKPEKVEAAVPAAATPPETLTAEEPVVEKPEVKVPEAEEVQEKEKLKEEKLKPEKEKEPEKIMLSEEDLAEVISEEMGAEGAEEEKETEKRKGRKSRSEESEKS
ncbi:MAG: 50S ribosomal protein L31e [Nitrososphaerales archaeon]